MLDKKRNIEAFSYINKQQDTEIDTDVWMYYICTVVNYINLTLILYSIMQNSMGNVVYNDAWKTIGPYDHAIVLGLLKTTQ